MRALLLCALLSAPAVLAAVVIAMGSLAERVSQRIAAIIGEEYGKQREVAQKCGRSDAWISNIVNGHAKLRLDDLEMVARALDVGIVDLIDDEPRAMMRLSLSEQDLVGVYRGLPERLQRRFLDVLMWWHYKRHTPK